MSLKARAKEFSERRLSYRTRLFARRVFVNSVGTAVRLAARLRGLPLAARLRGLGARTLDLAAAHGLDLERTRGATPAPPPRDADAPAALPPFGARDFLFLMETAARRTQSPTGEQTTSDNERQTLGDNERRTHGYDERQTAGEAERRTHGDGPRVIRASVVVPVRNRVEFTFQALRSLVGEIDLEETEIIVVDDASTDETPRLLSHFGGLVRLLRNEERRGFAGSCNRGAAEAAGALIVFLGRGAAVRAGWLKALLDTAERDAAVGAVGSMLLSPAGRVREAGGVVWRDGGAHPYGRGGSPEDRRLNFAREVDYCSGASLLIRRELFESLGGFDPRYEPADLTAADLTAANYADATDHAADADHADADDYAGDDYANDDYADAADYAAADLCFGVRSRGRKVVYQPLSRVARLGRAGAGAGSSRSVERGRVASREKFREKWHDTLEREHHARGSVGVERAADRRAGPRLLIVNDRLPTPDRDAGSLRILLALRILAGWARPAFVNLSKHRRPEYERELARIGVELVGPADYLRLARRGEFRVAVLSRPDVAEAVMPSLRRADPRIKILFDMVDAHFIRMGREAEVTGDARVAAEAARYRKLELRLARASDLVWCASAEDERAVRGGAPDVPVELIPTIHELRRPGGTFDERAGLLYVGNFSHRPNEDGLHFFMREIFPRVRAELPGVRLSVAGDGATDEVQAYESESVRVLGYVPSLEPLLSSSRVFVAPLRFGAGIKGKIGESLAHGLPVVTTSIGAEGMGLTPGGHALVTDDPAEFAAAVVRAYRERELWQRLADAGRRHVAEHFTPEAVGRTVNRSIRRLTGEAE